MKDLFLDFDGVLIDTIKVTYKMMERENISLDDKQAVYKFYESLDWDYLLETTPQIRNAFKLIYELKKSNMYRSVSILTTICSLQEGASKIKYVRKYDKDIKVILVPKGINKCDVVDANSSILVDDFSGNLYPWLENGGIPVKFSDKENNEFVTINTLESLMNKNLTKKLIKVGF